MSSNHSLNWTTSYGFESPTATGATTTKTLRTGLNLTYDLTSRLSSTTGVYYHHDENQGGEPARQGRRILSIFLLGLRYTINKRFALHVDYEHNSTEFARIDTGLLTESLFRRTELYLLRIYRRDSPATRSSTDKDRSIALWCRPEKHLGNACFHQTELLLAKQLFPCRLGNISESTTSSHRNDVAVLERRLFCDCAAGSISVSPSWPGKLRSHGATAFIHLIDTVCFCLSALPSARSTAEKYVADLPLGDRVAGRRSRRFAVHLLVEFRGTSAGRIMITSCC